MIYIINNMINKTPPMPAGMRGEKILRGSTLVYHLQPVTQANAAGFHIPRAPGRTFCRTPQDGLQPVTVPLFPELRGILFPIVALFDFPLL